MNYKIGDKIIIINPRLEGLNSSMNRGTITRIGEKHISFSTPSAPGITGWTAHLTNIRHVDPKKTIKEYFKTLKEPLL